MAGYVYSVREEAEEPENNMSWEDFEGFLAEQLDYRNVSKGHKADVLAGIRHLAAWSIPQGLLPRNITVRCAKIYLNSYGKNVSDATVKHRAVKLKWAYGAAAKNELWRVNELEGLEMPRIKRKTITPPTIDELIKIISAIEYAWSPEKNPKSRFKSEEAREFFRTRDIAMIFVLAECGLRMGELCKLQLGWIKLENRTILLPPEIVKTDEGRLVPDAVKPATHLAASRTQ